ncbi:MAG: flagellar hook-basal body complex protein FliE [Sphingorhabdus sp.]|uniref:flagellar hook-basal body complex protein FliE n=1 Tax=Sphingorhabdus sp. TaxID=1902408 RepID=UPI003C9D2491
MTEIFAITPISVDSPALAVNRLGVELPSDTLRNGPATSFNAILSAGMETMDARLAKADDLVRQFAVDDNVPVHQVTIAIEEARLSVELAMQVRARLIEGYRELMNMQL